MSDAISPIVVDGCVYVTRVDAAKLLDRTPRSVINYTHSGLLTPYRLQGDPRRRNLYLRTEVEDLAARLAAVTPPYVRLVGKAVS